MAIILRHRNGLKTAIYSSKQNIRNFMDGMFVTVFPAPIAVIIARTASANGITHPILTSKPKSGPGKDCRHRLPSQEILTGYDNTVNLNVPKD